MMMIGFMKGRFENMLALGCGVAVSIIQIKSAQFELGIRIAIKQQQKCNNAQNNYTCRHNTLTIRGDAIKN